MNDDATGYTYPVSEEAVIYVHILAKTITYDWKDLEFVGTAPT